jgi:FkbM family methyltransferase
MRFLSKLHRWIFARPLFQKFNSSLFHLALHGLGVLNYENASMSGEQYLLRKWLPNVIKVPNPVFFDVGANEGHYCGMLLEQFPTAFIHAFEPHPKNYLTFLGNKFPAHQVKCYNVAIGDVKSSTTLYDHADNAGSSHASLFEATITEFHEHSAVGTKVPVETLDDVAMRAGVTYIDFLKIDTEGNELAVLAGASQLLRENRIGHIQFEFNALHVFSRAFFRDFRNILSSYDLYRLLPRGLLPLDSNITLTEIFAFQNILAVPRVRSR